MRRSTRVAGAASIAVAAIALSLVFASSTEPRSATSAGLVAASGWRTYHSRFGGFQLRYPSDWHLVPFSSGCGTISAFGALASDSLAHLPSPSHGNGCQWPPSMDVLPPTGVAVMFQLLEGGAPIREVTVPPNTQLPITFSDLRRHGQPMRAASVTFRHRAGYVVDVFEGPAVSRATHRAAARILGSIRPWTPRRPSPNYGRCVSGWDHAPTPRQGVLTTEVRAVSAASSSDVWAVGSYSHLLPGVFAPPSRSGKPVKIPVGASTPLALHWDGTRWRLIPVPDPTVKRVNGYVEGGAWFQDVAAIARDDVWAVGGGDYGLIEHWNGSRWSVVPSPRVNLVDASLKAVAGTGPDDAWAVGWRGLRNGGVTAVVEHWDGSRWSVSPIPNVGTRNTTADAVSASSPTDAWVVGQRFHPALALHWDGTRWSSVATPTIRHPWLSGVIDLAPDDAWAVGTSYRDPDGRAPAHALIEHWDGSRWSTVPLPPLPSNSSLSDVSAAGPNDVWAIGWGENGGPEMQLVLHYDGTRWRRIAPPDVAPDTAGLGDVAATTAGAWLIGTEDSGLSYESDQPFVGRSC